MRPSSGAMRVTISLLRGLSEGATLASSSSIVNSLETDRKKRPRVSTAFHYISNWISRPKADRDPLAGGAQIVRRRLARATIRHDLVADLLAFTQCAKPGALYGADVHEHVVATVIRLNEAKALGSVKPLHGSHAHGIVPSQDRYTRSPLSTGWGDRIFGRVVSV